MKREDGQLTLWIDVAALIHGKTAKNIKIHWVVVLILVHACVCRVRFEV